LSAALRLFFSVFDEYETRQWPSQSLTAMDAAFCVEPDDDADSLAQMFVGEANGVANMPNKRTLRRMARRYAAAIPLQACSIGRPWRPVRSARHHR